ncbi:hypothetical protein Oweho_2059 [Owenweeksia hongkongensis DSM 17368]|uniref:Periplasmic protein n=1 Tax=Owenweeksia hongkongensis (strain DSM 17368 / CIP 108786 / JCM 12287 / NRRL B-23963 / UST20020801) TaxID=926562 RepID=G8R3H9_OWEHD|nr:SIMPL domain-containing protein [Owenweeksia hongkongensis]AEV33035.1 hypothetical protein Oweho_2059 [Owenweeksia hongkongensis DSM 17368]
MKNIGAAIAIGLALVITAIIAVSGIKQRNDYDDTIVVTGLGKKDFVSDLIVWSGSFSRLEMNLKEAYAKLDADREIIRKYFVEQGVKEAELVFSAVDISKDYEYEYLQNGNSNRVFRGYRLSQTVKIESKEVDKVENISREVTELINQGVEFNSNSPQFYYTGLSDLKLEMISAATKDGRLRAERIAENASATLGNLKEASMGVFQIIAQNSNEDYSWGGTYNTYAKKKTATITMRLEFAIR